ncbi:hypothetical protein UCDDS831_g07844 [Diplodia seriata]|uniref:Uncharacterized protein n=1 Tax=Diplodia seriata TaxID=420778 RepID=A0A0G2FT84_9PEZI|nr:hypothetical protein UCDDS831_g07844 [Diplodia seriata]
MSHWHSSKDYEWVEENLPKLTELDLSDLQDTMVCGDDFFEGSYPTTDSQGELSWKSQDLKTYEQLRSHKTLLGRLEKLWVRHWGCERLHDWRYRHGRSSDGLDHDELANAEIRSRRETADFGQVPGLNDFLLRLTDAFNHCDNFSFNDQEVINEIPVSPFSFIGLSSQSSSPGIFGDAANDEAIQVFRLLHQGFGWAPLWDLDPLLDAHNFPFNVGIEIAAAPEGDNDDDDDEDGRRATTTITRRLVAPILNAFRTLSHAGVPVRLLLGNRPRSPFLSNAGLYWGAAAAGHPAEGGHASWLTLPVDDADLVRHGDGGSQPPTSTATITTVETQRPQKEDEQQLAALNTAAGAAAAAANGPNNIAACADELVIRYQDWAKKKRRRNRLMSITTTAIVARC